MEVILGFLPVYLLYLYVLFKALEPSLQTLKTSRQSGRFQVTISDCWAASLALTPTVLLAAFTIQRNQFVEQLPGIVFLCTGQLTGIAMMAASNASPTRRGRSSGGAALIIVFGGMMGLFMGALAPAMLIISWLGGPLTFGDRHLPNRLRRPRQRASGLKGEPRNWG